MTHTIDSAMAMNVCSVQVTRVLGSQFQTVLIMATPAGRPTSKGQVTAVGATASESLALAFARLPLRLVAPDDDGDELACLLG